MDHRDECEVQPYFGGLPTGPEVKKLRAAFPKIEELRGSMIEHGQLEEILGYSRGCNRYRTVVMAWRKAVERETGVVISGIQARGEGFMVLPDGEQVSFGVRERKAAGRKIRRAFSVIQSTDAAKLSDQEKAVRRHELLFVGKMHAMLAEARKPITLPALARGVD